MAFSFTTNILQLPQGKLLYGTLTDVANTGSDAAFSGYGKVDWIGAQVSNAARAFKCAKAATANTVTITAATNLDDGNYVAIVDLPVDLTQLDYWHIPLGASKMSVGYVDECSNAGTDVQTGLQEVQAVVAFNADDTQQVLAAASATRGAVTLTVDTDTDSVYWMAVGY